MTREEFLDCDFGLVRYKNEAYFIVDKELELDSFVLLRDSDQSLVVVSYSNVTDYQSKDVIINALNKSIRRELCFLALYGVFTLLDVYTHNYFLAILMVLFSIPFANSLVKDLDAISVIKNLWKN